MITSKTFNLILKELDLEDSMVSGDIIQPYLERVLLEVARRIKEVEKEVLAIKIENANEIRVKYGR